MPTNLVFKYGLKANLPAVGVDKTFYWCTDTKELFLGNGAGQDPIGFSGSVTEAQVTGLVADLAAKAPTSRVLTASAPLTGGGDLSADRSFGLGNVFSLFSYLPNVALKSIYSSFVSPGAGAQNDIYTVPNGKRAILFSCALSNRAGGASSTFKPTVKIGGTYYTLTTAANFSGTIAAAAGQTATLQGGIYIAEVGEIFSLVNTTNTTFDVVTCIIEFDNTAPLKTVKITSPANGDQNFYTPVSGHKGFVVGNSFYSSLIAGSNFMTGFMYNNTGVAITVKWNYRRAGAAVSTSNLITGVASVSANTVAQTGQLPWTPIDDGDTLSVNLSAINTGGLLFMNIIEF